jgi:hypothetical protein
MACIYWEVGRLLDQFHPAGGWDRESTAWLARDLSREFPSGPAFPECTLGMMLSFYRAYSNQRPQSAEEAAQLSSLLRRRGKSRSAKLISTQPWIEASPLESAGLSS